MELKQTKALILPFLFLLVVVPVSANGFNLIIDSTLNYFIDTTEEVSSTSDSSASKSFASVQEEWNQGTFNGTSADRNDNSGDLGIGYLNGSNPAGGSLTEGLVGYWRLDRSVSDGGTLKDYSGYGNDGSLDTGGNTASGVAGILSTDAMQFDGSNDYISTSTSTRKKAVSLWYKNSSMSSWGFLADVRSKFYLNAQDLDLQNYPIYAGPDRVEIGRSYEADLSADNYQQVSISGASVKGIATDGEYVYIDDGGNNIIKAYFNGTVIATHAVNNLGGDNDQLAYADGHLYTRNQGSVYLINTTSWTSQQVTVDSAYPLQTGGSWLDGNLFGTSDGRIATVSSPSSSPITVRFYTVSDDGLTLTHNKDVELSETVSVDNHGFALIGHRYLTLISYESGAYVWDLATGKITYSVSDSTLGDSIGNPTFVTHDDKNNRLIVGDYSTSNVFLYPDRVNYFQGNIDEVRVYNRSLPKSEIEKLYFQGMNGEFNGTFTSEKIEKSEEQDWNKLRVDASVPGDTSLTARFKALDSDGTELEEQLIDIEDTEKNYTLDVNNSRDAELRFNGTSDKVTKTWSVDSFEVYSEEVRITEKSLDVQNQKDFNQGKFNGTSADRNENSGKLGIGYLNGTGSGQPNDNSLNDEDLVGYWRLDGDISDGGTVKDYSGNNNAGSLSTAGNKASEATGVLSSNGMEFDGSDDYIDGGDGSSLDGTNTFSLTAWIKPDDISTQGQRVIIKEDGSSGYAFSLGDPGSNQLRFYIRDDTSDYVDSDPVINADTWYHIAATYSSGSLEVYVNAVPEGTASISDVSPSSTTNLGVGADPAGSSGSHFDGTIDEPRVYNRTLSQEEIEELYFQGMNGKFNGTYTRSIDTSQEQNWTDLEINATIPLDTSLDAEFRAKDSSGTTLETESFMVDDTEKNYTLSLQESEDAEVFFNGTSANASKTWTVDDFAVYSKETGSAGGEVNWNKWS